VLVISLKILEMLQTFSEMSPRGLAVRATALIKVISKSSPMLDIVFAYGHFDCEIRSRAALRNKLGSGIEVWGGGISYVKCPYAIQDRGTF